MIAHGLPIYVALEPVDMRLGAERLGAQVRERMRAEPRSRALFVFVGKRGHSMMKSSGMASNKPIAAICPAKAATTVHGRRVWPFETKLCSNITPPSCFSGSLKL